MTNKTSIKYLRAALIRAIRTMAQVALSYLTIGMTISEIDWMALVSVTVVAGIYSLLTSIVTTLPEGGEEVDGIMRVDETDPNVDRVNMQLDIPLEEFFDGNKKTITFKVERITDEVKAKQEV